MNREPLSIDEDLGLSMKVTHSGHLPYYYLKHHRGRVVEYATRNLDVDPYASGERSLSGRVGSRCHVNLIASTLRQRWQVVFFSSLISSGQISDM